MGDLMDDEKATGSVFMVQTLIPYGDPARGLLLRMVVQATCEATVGEMMAAIEADKVLVGDHFQFDRDKSTLEIEVSYLREPIALPHRLVGYLKPYRKRIVEIEQGARPPRKVWNAPEPSAHEKAASRT